GPDNSACPWYDRCGVTFARGCSWCPPGYANDACTCRRDASIFAKPNYWRGGGTALPCGWDPQCDVGTCYRRSAAGASGSAAFCYLTWPSGYTDTGLFCSRVSISIIGKSTYSRGAGSLLRCAADKDESLGLCYTRCAEGFEGKGAVCFRHCPSGYRDAE